MDIVERLRSDYGIGYETRIEAADEIERLREENFNLRTEVHFDDQTIKSLEVINERLREALKQFCDSYEPHLMPERCQYCSDAYWIARAALKESE